MAKVVATVTGCVQVGENTFQQHSYSRVFSDTRSLGEIISWATSMNGKPASINDIQLSDYTGESL